jgi:CubicO group peptidase (beta-lactamase class C family)
MPNTSVLRTFTFFCLTVFAAQLCHAQPDQKHYNEVADLIRAKYNGGQATDIYALTADVFQKKMTADQFVQGMSKFKAKSGEWKNLTFQQSNDKGVDYLCEFGNGNQVFSLKLEPDGKISRLNFAAVQVVIKNKDYRVRSNNPLIDSIDILVEKLVRPYIQKGNTAGLLVALIEDGRVRRYSYGSINKTQEVLADPANTIFEIGSVTKTFTSLLLAKQVIAGKMKLEDPISKYLPDSIPALTNGSTSLTLKHLANHTSGLPRLPANIFNGKVNPKDPYKHYLADSLYHFIKTYQVKETPGTTFSYSNLGSGLLGMILEHTSGKSFNKLIVEEIARPLGMLDTKIELTKMDENKFAQGHNEMGQATAPWDLASLKGSGAIRSTLNDMVLYVQAQLGQENPMEKAIELTHQKTFSSYEQDIGLGWRIIKNQRSSYLHHSGGTGGFRSFVGFDQHRQIGVVILSNAAEEVTEIGEYMLKR